MSDGQKKFLIWVAIIFFLSYLAGINLGHLAASFGQSVQTIHNQNTHP